MDKVSNDAPQVSVIVPIYNAEGSLRRCVDSLLAQTLKAIELILVNDGSRDSSKDICDEYATRDPRVKVIHKPNEGVAATRMAGIDKATGEYSIQVDSDDWVEPTMLEDLYAKAKQDDADVVICDFYYDYGGRKPLKRRVQCPQSLDRMEVLAELLEYRRLSPSLANKLIRHSCYRQFQVRIPADISHGEDFFTSLSILRCEGVRVTYLPNAYYHYMQDVGSTSLTHTYSVHDFHRECRLKDYCLDLMHGHSLYERLEQRMVHNIVRRAFNGGVFTSAEFKRLTYGYRHQILGNHRIAWHRRWRLYLSCIGLYRLMYSYKATASLVKKQLRRG